RSLTLLVICLFTLLVGASAAVVGWLTFGLLGGVIFFVVAAYFAKPHLVTGDIEPAEKVSWQLDSVKRSLFPSLFSGLLRIILVVLLAIADGFLALVSPGFEIYGIRIHLLPFPGDIFIIVGGSLLLLIHSGWTSEMLDEDFLVQPNE